MNVSRRARVAASLLAAVVAVLAFAAVASAEVRSGESTDAIVEGTLTPEITVVRATASYDTAGSVQFAVATAAPPQELIGGEPNPARIEAFLVKASLCDLAGAGTFGLPEAFIQSPYGEPITFSGARSLSFAENIPATKTVSGTTTTLSMSAGVLAKLSFNCALVAVLGAEDNEGNPEGKSVMIFPLLTPPPPPATTPSGSSSTPPASNPAPPAAAHAVLSIPKSKPVEAKVGKWRTVKVKVVNSGETTTSPGSFRVKPVKGVLVNTESQKLPELAPGTSWALSVRVKVTEGAKQKSTLQLIATASGVTAKGSLVVKRGA